MPSADTAYACHPQIAPTAVIHGCRSCRSPTVMHGNHDGFHPRTVSAASIIAGSGCMIFVWIKTKGAIVASLFYTFQSMSSPARSLLFGNINMNIQRQRSITNRHRKADDCSCYGRPWFLELSHTSLQVDPSVDRIS